MEQFLQVGVISSTHGLRGEVKVFPTTDDAARFQTLKEVILDTGKEKLDLEIQSVRFFKQFVIVKFKVQKGDKLIALVHPDYDEAQTLNLGTNELADVMEQNRNELNTMIPAYSKVSEIRIHEDEFEKTPKKSIKRFLYTAE